MAILTSLLPGGPLIRANKTKRIKREHYGLLYTRRKKLAQIFTQIVNDCVSRNDRRINTTEINQMIFIEDSLFYLMKSKYAIFSNIKVTKVERSAFGGTYWKPVAG